MAKRQRQVGRKEEAPLAIVGSSEVSQQPPQIQIFISEDTEYHFYQNLLQGYFEKFAEWQKIFLNEEYLYDRYLDEVWKRRFQVLRTEQGATIDKVHNENSSPYFESPPNRVLYAEMYYVHSPPDKEGKYGIADVMLDLIPGAAGKQLFVDADGKPLERAVIGIGLYWSDTWRELTICELYPGIITSNSESERDQDIKFDLRDGRIQISKDNPRAKDTVLMPINHATHLIDTIDSLIPQTNPHKSEQNRKVER